MRLKFLFLIAYFFLISFVSSQTQINIYLDKKGNAEFYGITNNNPELPNGIYIKNGNILGSTQQLTKKDEEIWFFNYSLKDSEINLILPEDCIVKDLKKGEIYMEDNKFSIYNPESIEVYYTFSKNRTHINYFNYLLALIIILLISFFIYKKIHTNSKKNLEIIRKTLNERENLILDKLLEVKQVKQSQLSKLTNIPKASLFRHLIQLEKKGLIKRKGEGKNKIIFLK